ncbi:MAG: DUF3261 domain-containing protein [Candidatus Ratteibacteria bacterium]|jgi:hypothetical protein
MRILLISLLLTCFGGCGSISFEPTALVSVQNTTPEKIRNDFAKSLPGKFELLNSVVFQYGTRSFVALGYTSVDIKNKTFAVTGLNPAGIKLFDLSGNDTEIEAKFMLPELSAKDDFAKAVAESVRKIYFDRIPPASARIIQTKKQLIFQELIPGGMVEYIFTGADNLLTEKSYYRNGRPVFSIFYYEYLRDDSKLYPQEIVFKNQQYHYQLRLRLKQINP